MAAPVMLISSAGLPKKTCVSEVELIDNRFSAFGCLLEEQSKRDVSAKKRLAASKTLARRQAGAIATQSVLHQLAVGALDTHAYYSLSLPQRTLLRNRTPPERS